MRGNYRDGVVLSGQGEGVGTADRLEPSIGHDGVGPDEDLVDTGHHGKDGGIWDKSC